MRPGCIRNQIRSCRTVRCLAFLGWGRSWLRVPMFARVRLRHWHVGGRINVFDRRRGWYRDPGALDPVIGSGGHDIRIHQHHQQLHQRRLVDRRIHIRRRRLQAGSLRGQPFAWLRVGG